MNLTPGLLISRPPAFYYPTLSCIVELTTHNFRQQTLYINIDHNITLSFLHFMWFTDSRLHNICGASAIVYIDYIVGDCMAICNGWIMGPDNARFKFKANIGLAEVSDLHKQHFAQIWVFRCLFDNFGYLKWKLLIIWSITRSQCSFTLCHVCHQKVLKIHHFIQSHRFLWVWM